MAYRKTEKVLAHLEARRAGIIAAAIDVIARSGMEGLTTDAVAERAAIAVGLIYKYFPDKTELLAAVVAQLLARDVAAIREASNTFSLSGMISWLALHMASNYRLMSAIGREPIYREGMKRELARLIRAGGQSDSPAIAASFVYGGLLETAAMGARFEPKLTSMARRCLSAHSDIEVV